MCIICTDPIESLLELDGLNCSGCPDLVVIPDTLTRLTSLYCSHCPLLVSIPATLAQLRTLDCSYCPLLASIPPTLVSLACLICHYCPTLASVPPTLVSLTRLSCDHCPCLGVIPLTLTRLQWLNCTGCRLLVSAPYTREFYCYGCPWLPYNARDFPDHIPSLLRIQRWFRYGKKQVFRRVIRTRAFNEFVFHPERIGGKMVKRKMEAELGAMRPEKKQRVE